MDKASQILLANLDEMLTRLSASVAQPKGAYMPQKTAIDGSVAVRNDDDRVVLTVTDPEGHKATVILTIAQAYALSHNLEDMAQGLELADSEGY